MTIGKICNRETIIITADRTIVDAARLMRDQHVGDLVVVEELSGRRIPVGILTDRDLVVEILAKEISLGAVTVGDVMTREPLTARETDSIYDTMQRMRAKGVRRIPVVDAGGSLVGIVAVDDFLDLLSDELTALARVVTREQARERQNRPA
jgi:CBS domain-containing protein